MDLFNVDTIELGRGFALDDYYWKDWQLPDGTSCKIPAFINLGKEDGDWYIYSDDGTSIGVQRKGALYFDQIYRPLMDSEDENFDDLEAILDKVI